MMDEPAPKLLTPDLLTPDTASSGVGSPGLLPHAPSPAAGPQGQAVAATPSAVLGEAPQGAEVLLDEPQRWPEFSDPAEGGAWVSRISVRGMHCAACAITVEAALKQVPGVAACSVNAATGRAWVRWLPTRTRPSEWLAAIERSGYRGAPVRGLDMLDLARREQRAMLWRWLVAGFCMMQVMMYAWPNYGAMPGDIDPDSDRLLRWASFLLSLPVLLFSSGPFFKAALRDLRQGRIGMDAPVALGILLTFAISSVAAFRPEGPLGKELYFDSLTMFVFILLSGRWIETRLRAQTAGALDRVAEQLPMAANRLRADGSTELVASDRLHLGDLLRVRAGEGFPVDGEVVSGRSWADEALLTGESQPVQKRVGDAVAAGSINLSETLEVRALKLGRDTRFAQIVDLMERSAQYKTRTIQVADRIAQPFLLAVVAVAALAFAGWWGTDPHRALLAAIGVLIVTCPCALALAAPTAMLTSAATLARRGVLVRDLGALERLAGIDAVAFDKTGTLTGDSIDVTRIHNLNAARYSDVLSMAAALAAQSLHPASRALVRKAADAQAPVAFWVASQVRESAGQGLEGLLGSVGDKGHGQRLRLGSADFCRVPDALRSADSDQMEVWLADGDGPVARFELSETLRPDAAQTLRQLQAMGLDLAIYSGDTPRSVRRVARELGLPDGAAPGDGAAGTATTQAACSAQDKLDALQARQARGQRVAMVGDGINDAPVLAGADASFAFSRGAALAQVRADFLLLQPRLAQVPMAIDQAVRTMRIVRQNLWWAVLYNLIAVPLALAGWLTPWIAGLGMALSSLAVLINAARLRRISM